MQKTNITLLIFLLFFLQNSMAQTVENPVAIRLLTETSTISPEHPSYIVVQFKIPKGILLGADPDEARTPPGTKITPKNIAGFHFKEAMYPDPIQEWVPAKLGTTNVFKETVNIVVPFSVDKNVPQGEYDLTFYITYTPGYNAGRLATHHKEAHSIKIKVDNSAKKVTIPAPSLETVSDDFYVSPKSYEDISPALRFLFKPLNEGNGLIQGFHKLWLDKPGHGKSVRFMPFPSMSSTNITSSSIGMGAAFFNSTKEGTMTSMISMSGFYNDLIGGGVSLQAISCPGAYHNYQFGASLGAEGYRDISLFYENYTLADSKYGFNFSFRSLEEPRMRFFGLGNESQEEAETAYRKTNLHAGLDVYAVAIQNFRFGIGLSYDDFEVGTSFDDIVTTENVALLHNATLSDQLLGINGSSLLGFKANVIYDHRDQEFSPSKGFYTKMTLSRNSISNTENDLIESNFYGLDIDMRQYISGPSQKIVLLMRAGASFKSESNLPFYMLSSLGGPNSVRAYDFERFLGQHSAFASAEMRYTLFTVPVLGYPMSVEMGAFLDVGRVFGDTEGVDSSIKVDPGISIRMINKPNVGLILNLAYGDDGGYFTGGIGLPF